MTYADIADQNKLYFGYLESLTLQISFCKERGLTDRITYLENKKNTVKVLIEMNLDKIEMIWTYGDVRIRRAKRAPYKMVPGKDIENVIGMYVANPNQSLAQISALSGVTISKTTRIIEQYLNNYKTPVSA